MRDLQNHAEHGMDDCNLNKAKYDLEVKPSVILNTSEHTSIDDCTLIKEKYDLDVRPPLIFERIGAIQVHVTPKVYQRKE